MKYAQSDINGNITAFFDDSINSTAQIGVSVSITDAQWLDCVAHPGKWLIYAGALELAPPPQVAQIPADVPAVAQARIDAAYTAAVQAVVGAYPADEISSWGKQEAEARAWTANNSASTPWIDAAIAARGVTKADMVNRIITNADQFVVVQGTYTGKRQKLRDQITSLGANPTQSQLDSIQW